MHEVSIRIRTYGNEMHLYLHTSYKGKRAKIKTKNRKPHRPSPAIGTTSNGIVSVFALSPGICIPLISALQTPSYMSSLLDLRRWHSQHMLPMSCRVWWTHRGSTCTKASAPSNWWTVNLSGSKGSTWTNGWTRNLECHIHKHIRLDQKCRL